MFQSLQCGGLGCGFSTQYPDEYAQHLREVRCEICGALSRCRASFLHHQELHGVNELFCTLSSQLGLVQGSFEELRDFLTGDVDPLLSSGVDPSAGLVDVELVFSSPVFRV